MLFHLLVCQYRFDLLLEELSAPDDAAMVEIIINMKTRQNMPQGMPIVNLVQLEAPSSQLKHTY